MLTALFFLIARAGPVREALHHRAGRRERHGEAARIDVVVQVVAMLVAREPDLDAVDAVNARVAPVDRPLGGRTAPAARAPHAGDRTWQVEHAVPFCVLTRTIDPGRSTSRPRGDATVLAATTAM